MARPYRRTHEGNLVRYHHVCQQCGVTFNSSRPDAVFHAPKCREKNRRERRAALERDRLIELARLAEAERERQAEAELLRLAQLERDAAAALLAVAEDVATPKRKTKAKKRPPARPKKKKAVRRSAARTGKGRGKS